MRPTKLVGHLKSVHPEHSEKPLEYFKRLNDQNLNKQKSLDTMLKTQISMNERGLQASYELSFLLARKSRPHTDGEELLKPAFEIYLRTIQDNKGANRELATLPLSNDTVSHRINEIADYVRMQFTTILQTTNFSLAFDESTIRDSEAILLAYARFIHNSKFMEEMMFCESLTTKTTARDIYNLVKKYLIDNHIPTTNLVSTAADGAPTMMGRHKGLLKLLKEDNPDMMTVHCIIHREFGGCKS